MGDRANVRVHPGDKENRAVYLYTHWDGYKLPHTLKTALERGRKRWSDCAYLARIIFCEMIKDDVDGTSGFGIAASDRDVDGTYRILDVDCKRMQVTFEGDWGEDSGVSYTFGEYVSS